MSTTTTRNTTSKFSDWSFLLRYRYEPVHYAEKMYGDDRNTYSRIFANYCGSRGLLMTEDKDLVTCPLCKRKLKGEPE